MREDLLHYIWKNQKFKTHNLKTSEKDPVKVIHTGHYNTSSGPDFFNSRIRIGDQEWVGNLEIHIKASDWYVHGHEKDANYDNVILHVVWEDDVAIFRKDGSTIPTLALANYLDEALLVSYQDLVHGTRYAFINCEKDAQNVDTLVWHQWQERVFVERLERKSQQIEHLLQKTKNDWEVVLFMLLMKTFGLNKNGGAFLSMAEHMEGASLRKVLKNAVHLESLFFGLSGFLEEDQLEDRYYQKLKGEFEFLKNKFQIKGYIGEKPVFFGLRPANFPTVRLSQLANVYEKSSNLFGSVMDGSTIDDFFSLFHVAASPYWDDHFTFGKLSRGKRKFLSKSFIRLVVINTVIPLKFCYDKHHGNDKVDGLLDMMNALPVEKNAIISKYTNIGISSKTAFESQAKIQLYQEYCVHNKCLQCQIGTTLLRRKS